MEPSGYSKENLLSFALALAPGPTRACSCNENVMSRFWHFPLDIMTDE